MSDTRTRVDGARLAIDRLFDWLGIGSLDARRDLDEAAKRLQRMPDEALVPAHVKQIEVK
jgi:hypothetical protein